MNKINAVVAPDYPSISAEDNVNGTLVQGVSGELYMAFTGIWIRLKDGRDWGAKVNAIVLTNGTKISLEVA